MGVDKGRVVPSKSKTELSAAAVFAFVLGLASCFSCGLGVIPGVPALILGSIAIFRSRKTVMRLVDTGLGVGGILLACFGIAVCFGWVPKSWLPPVSHGPSCQYNLKQIGTCLKMYADEHDHRFPDRLSALYPIYLSDPSILVCPETRNTPGDPARIDQWSEYTLLPGLRVTGTPADERVQVCFDSEYRHTLPSRNVLYLDGHVQFHPLKQPSNLPREMRP